jgi:uncharacterized protein
MPRIPRDNEYFVLFDQLASYVCEASELFCDPEKSTETKAEKLKAIEHQADEVVHAVVDKLDIHRDPPLDDMEDIYALVHKLDNVLDYLEEATDRICRYELEYTPVFITLGQLIGEATQEIKQGFALMRDIKKNAKIIKEAHVKINDLENVGDGIYREALSNTRACYAADPLGFVLVKEVLDMLEKSLDQCEDVGDFLDSLKKKNA